MKRKSSFSLLDAQTRRPMPDEVTNLLWFSPRWCFRSILPAFSDVFLDAVALLVSQEEVDGDQKKLEKLWKLMAPRRS